MRHRKAGRKIGRTTAHRRALFRNQVTSLLDKERIRTTHAKAKELRGIADGMITLGKRGNLHARRQALAFIKDRRVVAKVFESLASRYAERPGGYTRVLRLHPRPGDNAEMALIELVDREEETSPKEESPPKEEASPPDETQTKLRDRLRRKKKSPKSEEEAPPE